MYKSDSGSYSILEKQLRTYTGGDMYPMHMPGHKRRMCVSPSLPCDIDVTEVEGTDDLHHASGILWEAMERTAFLYGSRRTWYLVNGSTCGILAAVRACTHFGGSIVAARNCHRSVYHAIELCGLHVRYIWPDIDEESGIAGSIRPLQVLEALERCPGCEAVILTSPTYEGVLSDISEIAGICHRRDIPLIVDEAHGAHLGLFPEYGFPKGALEEGADLVIQSPHKTLMSLTQTAWMHLGTDRISEREIERQLAVFETSSPSYPLLVSLDGCSCMLRERGEEIFEAWRRRLSLFDREVRGLHNVRILWHGDESGRTYENFFEMDPSKIVILCGDKAGTGYDLAGRLRESFQIETELAFPEGVLAMTGAGDSEEGLLRLARALHVLDNKTDGPGMESHNGTESHTLKPPPRPRTLCTILEASERDSREMLISDAEGAVSAEYLYLYPPGVPILVPGEVISREVLDFLSTLEESGAHVHKSRGSSRGKILCADE